MAFRWALHGDGIATEQDGAIAVHEQDGPDAAAAALILTHGRHHISVEIVRSERNRGFMYLGVLSADETEDSFPPTPISRAAAEPGKGGMSEGTGKAIVGWALCPLNGHLHTVASPSHWGERKRKLLAGDLSGRAEGAVIAMIVDMDKRTLAFMVRVAIELIDVPISVLSGFTVCVPAHTGERRDGSRDSCAAWPEGPSCPSSYSCISKHVIGFYMHMRIRARAHVHILHV